MNKPNILNRPVPKRLSIIMALQDLLEQISEQEGDAYTLRGRVYRNRILLGADVTDNPPCLSIVEAPRPDIAQFAAEGNFMRKDNLTLMIQGLVANDRTSDTEDLAYYLCQDVERRLLRLSEVKPQSGNPMYPGTHMLGGKITSVEIAPPVVRPPEAEISKHSFFYLPVRLGVGMKVGE